MNIEETKCLHCGKEEPRYCEKCYQDLIAQNAMLQFELQKLRKQYEELSK